MSLSKRLIAATTCAAFVGVLSAGSAMATQGDKVGETQMCVQANDIDQTPVIDHKTILLKMRGATRGYKRVDLGANCTGLNNATPFAFDTKINKLCVQDTLHIVETAGQTCIIDKIVTIDDQEAKDLLKHKRE